MEYTERTKAEQIANAYFDTGAGWAESGGLLRDLREMEQGYLKQLADAQAQIESLQRERNEAIERAEQCRKDRAMVLTVKTTDGLTASEWLMRTAVAEQKAKDIQTALDAEREKTKEAQNENDDRQS